MRRLNSVINAMNMSLGKLQEIVEDPGAWLAMVHGSHKELVMTDQQKLLTLKLS